MRLHSLSFRNFKSFKDETEIVLKDINYIIGPNGAGKSNILHGIQILSRLLNETFIPASTDYFDAKLDADMSLSFVIEMSDDDRDKIFDQTSNYTSNFFRLVKYKATFNNNALKEMTLSITDSNGDFKPCVLLQSHNNNNHVLQKCTIDYSTQQIPEIRSQTIAAVINERSQLLQKFSQESGELLLIIQKFFVGLAMVDSNRKSQRSVKAHETSDITLDGSNMPNEINSLRREKRPKLDEVLKKISSGDITEIDVKMESDNNVIVVYENGLENPTDHARLSSGQNQMTLFAHLLIHTLPQLVIIEEPELHLHAKAQKEMLQLIRERSTDKQFIIETHSPIFANVREGESTFLVTKIDGATEVVPVDESNMGQIRLEMGITHSDYFDNDLLCFVEGDSEHVSLPVFAKKMGYEIGVGLWWWNLSGYGNIKNLKVLLQYLNSSDRKIFLLLDKNSDAEKHLGDLVEKNLIKQEMCHVLEKNFEDLFPSKHLIEITEALALDKQVQFELSADNLDKLRKDRNVDKILEEYWKKNQKKYDYPKKELAKKLAEHDDDIPQGVSEIIENIMKRFGVRSSTAKTT